MLSILHRHQFLFNPLTLFPKGLSLQQLQLPPDVRGYPDPSPALRDGYVRWSPKFGQVVKSGVTYKKTLLEGKLDTGIASCGQLVGLIHDIPSAKEVIDSIIAEAKVIRQQLSSSGILGN